MFSDSLLEFKILQVEDGQMEDGFYRLKGIWYKYYSQGYISMQCAVKTNLTETGSWSRPSQVRDFQRWDEVNTKTKAGQDWVKTKSPTMHEALA